MPVCVKVCQLVCCERRSVAGGAGSAGLERSGDRAENGAPRSRKVSSSKSVSSAQSPMRRWGQVVYASEVKGDGDEPNPVRHNQGSRPRVRAKTPSPLVDALAAVQPQRDRVRLPLRAGGG